MYVCMYVHVHTFYFQILTFFFAHQSKRKKIMYEYFRAPSKKNPSMYVASTTFYFFFFFFFFFFDLGKGGGGFVVLIIDLGNS